MAAAKILAGPLMLLCGRYTSIQNKTFPGQCSESDHNSILTTCLQQGVACILYVALILLLSFLVLHQKLREKRAQFQESFFYSRSKLNTLSFVLSTLAFFGNWGIAMWFLYSKIINQNQIANHDVLFYMIHGLTWFVAAMLFKERKISVAVKSWWIAIFLIGTVMATLSFLDLFKGKCLTLYGGVILASWPICFLLLACALEQSHSSDLATREFLEPLLLKSPAEEDWYTGITLEKKADFLSRVTFSWMNPLLELGYSRPLQFTDVPLIAPEDQCETNYRVFSELWESQKNKPSSSRRSIFFLLAQCYSKDLLFTCIYAFSRTVSVTAAPLLVRFFVDYAGGNKLFKHEGYVLVGGLFIVKSIESLSQRHWYFGARRLGMKIRSALITAIHQKELCLSSLAKRKHGTGEIVNYIGTDAYRVGDFTWWVHWAWIVPLQISMATAIFFTTVGLATVPGLLAIFLLILISSPRAKLLQTCQNRLMEAQDQRMRATTEVLSGMKVIKLQAWEDKFKALIDKLREKEFHWLQIGQKTRAYGAVIFWMTPIIAGSVILFSCIFLKITLTASTIFTVLATLRIIQEPVRMVPEIFAAVVQARVSLKRIDTFLHADELQTDAVERIAESEYAIKMDDCMLSWNPDLENKPTLKGINMQVIHREKIAVCGTIGSGKSTLLHSILGEVPRLSGTVRVSGRVAYVAQSAWIQSGTVRDNILFGKPMDELHYKKTLQSCALEEDIANFHHGDLTEIGERGMNLSGGQKQRIQLARAVYNDADIYVLDDPFSAVDAHTASILFHDCVLGALRHKTIVLVTHQIEFLPALDHILVMQEGEIKHSGSYEQLLKESNIFRNLVDSHHEALVSVSYKKDMGQDDAPNLYKGLNVMSAWESKQDISGTKTQFIQAEEREIGDTGFKPYFAYVRISGGSIFLAGMLLGQAAFVSANISSSIWLGKKISDPGVSVVHLIGVYTILLAVGGVFVYLRSMLSAKFGLKASASFYSRLMNSIIKAPMSFFDSTPTGRILSRASADLSILDLNIPFCFGAVIAGSLDLIGIFVVVALVTWQILIIAIPMVFVVRCIQSFYLASCRELVRMNSSSKAPILNNSSETMNGAITIRAFQKLDFFKRKNMQLVDSDASIFFHIQGAAEWLSIRLEAVGNLVLVVAALLLVSLPEDKLSPGFAGLAVSYAIGINSCQIFLVWWQCCLANYIVSAERIQQYMQLPREAPEFIEDKGPPRDWPSKGEVMLDNLKIRYRVNSPMVLKGVTCTFEGGHKVGVVGRTGSGKTTLISALFRLVEPAGGRIVIDDVDICSIGLHELRLRLGIIPQDPILFRGTVRSNLDPLTQYSDFEIWETLDKCQLGQLIRQLPRQLDSIVSEEGENWSGGQRQLFCLGRVLLKRTKILVLDEATASIDATTDALLQTVIRTEFSECTVITVAHRVPTVINSDMVLALRDGYLAEFGPPQTLMEQQGTSMFAKLVAEYWAQSSHSSRQQKLEEEMEGQ